MTREIDVLLSCCGAGQSREAEARLERLLGNGVDWDRFVRMALWHRLVPILYQNHRERLERHAPAETMERLRATYVYNAHRALKMSGRLLEILSRFEDDGIVAVPYKGPVLGARLYGNLALRVSSDLDILVRRDDVEGAEEILRDMGYEPGYEIEDRNRAFMLESRYSERFQDANGSVVELHWAFTNKDVAFPLTLDHLLPRLEEFDFVNRKTRLLSPEDLLLILCVHGAKHRWDRLEWLYGLGELVRTSSEELDWSEVLERARETRCEGPLLLGLALASDICGVSLPERVTERIRDDHRVRRLAADVKELLREGVLESKEPEDGDLGHDLFHVRLRDRHVDRLRYVLYRITTPSRPDSWSTVSFKGRSLPLHSILRPFRLVAKIPLAAARLLLPGLGKRDPS